MKPILLTLNKLQYYNPYIILWFWKHSGLENTIKHVAVNVTVILKKRHVFRNGREKA